MFLCARGIFTTSRSYPTLSYHMLCDGSCGRCQIKKNKAKKGEQKRKVASMNFNVEKDYATEALRVSKEMRIRRRPMRIFGGH